MVEEITINQETENPETKNQESQMQWNFDDILTDDQFDNIFQELRKDIDEFQKYKQDLNPNITEEKFIEIINFKEGVAKKVARLGSFVALKLAANMKDSESLAKQNKLDSLSIEINDKSIFFSHWMKGLKTENLAPLDDENAKRLFQNSKLKDFKYSLEYSRLAAKHTLKENEEKIIHRKDTTGIEVVTQLYDLITNDFIYTLEIVGQESKKINNQQELLKFVYSSNAKEREAAYKALFKEYKNNIEKLYLIYSAVAKDWAEEAKLRNYESSIAVRNFANRIPDAAINTLLEVCKDNLKIYQDFFKLKAKMLGLEKLRRYDLYAPLKQNESHINFEEAQEIVFTTFDKFSSDFNEKAKSILQKNHLDSHPRENKRSGAFCMSIIPEVHPFVLTNFDGTNRAVSTLAHELGHAVHDLYASEKPYSVSHAPLPLCETASTFAEMVVFEALLEKAENKEEKQALLLEKIASNYATIIRQNYFILFEIKAHEMLQNGASQDDLNEAYFELLKEQFGDSVELSEDFKYEWSYIPHIFHSPFYCYAYNFGELLSLALFAMYKKEGAETFLPKLEKLLKAGGSEEPATLLQSIGVDITKKEFWQGGFKIVKEWIEKLKE